MERSPNRLVKEQSPYLLQHAYNPVDWHPWSAEAFERARDENKPIFLSIGYSTCHWCHVMEKESFEDQHVAKLMNEAFISIKVDREERPDLDHIYMMVCQMLTGSGGWPLTILMTPEKKPFFAATYIPRNSRFGTAGMIDLIPHIQKIWATKPLEILESAEKITGTLRSIEEMNPGTDMDRTVLDKAFHELADIFDRECGGFGKAPKFPTPHNLLFLLRYWRRSGDSSVLDMVEKTLERMRIGGIYDQIGFGFHRYSTDREWIVPHFEKMLYDQALLAMAYLEACQATGNKEYGDTAREIFTYVLRDMTDPGGGFYSAEDADSEGEEGKYYTWEEREVRSILTQEEAEFIIRTFNLRREGNFRNEASGRITGANILYLRETLTSIAKDSRIPVRELRRKIASAGKKLFEYREKRIHPHRDDKILTDWNGLMVAALAKGAQVLGRREYVYAAMKAADFIMNFVRRPDGRLLHRYRRGNASITSTLDDYAFLVWGMIELYESTFDTRYLKTAIELNQDMITHFWDEDRGGLFFTPDDGEDLIVRKKETYDGAVPSGNSVAMLNMLRLARFTASSELEEKAAAIGRAFSNSLKERPSAYANFMNAVDFSIGPSYEVVISGISGNNDTNDMINALRGRFLPNKVVMLRSAENASLGLDELAGFLKHHVSIEGRATAYVCVDNSCKTPTTEVSRMLELIR